MNDENLIPFDKRTESEKRRIAKMGGKASGKKRQMLSTFRDCAQYVLKLKANDAAVDIISKRYPEIPREEITNRMAMFLAQMSKAIAGDTQAFDRIQQTAGEKEPETNVVIQRNDPIDLKESIKEVKDLLKDL